MRTINPKKFRSSVGHDANLVRAEHAALAWVGYLELAGICAQIGSNHKWVMADYAYNAYERATTLGYTPTLLSKTERGR